jgi:hypothetical protein
MTAKIAFILALVLPLTANAQVMTSTNYKIPFDAFSEGGGHSTSTNYIAEDTIAENSAPSGEDLSSANYLACVGYQCLFGEAPAMTTVIATSLTPCTTSTTGGTMTADLGLLDPSHVSTSPTYICVIVSTNTITSLVVQARDANGALVSISTPADTIPSHTATLVPGTTGYGYCSSNAQNGFTATPPFNGSCDTSTHHEVGGITPSAQTIWSASGPITSAVGELLTKASIDSSVPAHNDYADTLTITVTGTF